MKNIKTIIWITVLILSVITYNNYSKNKIINEAKAELIELQKPKVELEKENNLRLKLKALILKNKNQISKIQKEVEFLNNEVSISEMKIRCKRVALYKELDCDNSKVYNWFPNLKK